MHGEEGSDLTNCDITWGRRASRKKEEKKPICRHQLIKAKKNKRISDTVAEKRTSPPPLGGFRGIFGMQKPANASQLCVCANRFIIKESISRGNPQKCIECKGMFGSEYFNACMVAHIASVLFCIIYRLLENNCCIRSVIWIDENRFWCSISFAVGDATLIWIVTNWVLLV